MLYTFKDTANLPKMKIHYNLFNGRKIKEKKSNYELEVEAKKIFLVKTCSEIKQLFE